MTAASGQETAGMPGATLHLGFDPLIQPVSIRKQTWTVVPEGTLANLHTSGITGQGVVSREAMSVTSISTAGTPLFGNDQPLKKHSPKMRAKKWVQLLPSWPACTRAP